MLKKKVKIELDESLIEKIDSMGYDKSRLFEKLCLEHFSKMVVGEMNLEKRIVTLLSFKMQQNDGSLLAAESFKILFNTTCQEFGLTREELVKKLWD